MARFKRPKPKERHEPFRTCSLCREEITEEQYDEMEMFLTLAPCLMPGWAALKMAGFNTMPVIWGLAIARACATCSPRLEDYGAMIDLLIEEEGVEPTDKVRTNGPLTWAQAEQMLEDYAADRPTRVTVPSGYLVTDEEAAALEKAKAAKSGEDG